MKYALALTICLIPNAAWAEMVCDDRAAVIKNLHDRWGEEPVGQGESLTGQPPILELFATPNGETWTILLSGSDGKSCLFLAGKNWTGTGHPVGSPL